VGIFEEIATTDTLGRRSGPRKRHPLEEKRRIVEETLVAGASVAVVARRNHVNANQVFGWRRQYREGTLGAVAQDDAKMLPVEVSTPTILPTERATAPAPIQSPRVESTSRRIEIRLRNGHGIVLHGWTDDDALLSAIDLLLKR
jgi:transposase